LVGDEVDEPLQTSLCRGLCGGGSGGGSTGRRRDGLLADAGRRLVRDGVGARLTDYRLSEPPGPGRRTNRR
jgi:hypothetical protein